MYLYTFIYKNKMILSLKQSHLLKKQYLALLQVSSVHRQALTSRASRAHCTHWPGHAAARNSLRTSRAGRAWWPSAAHQSGATNRTWEIKKTVGRFWASIIEIFYGTGEKYKQGP